MVAPWKLFDPEKVPELNPDPLQEQRLAGIARVREELESAGVEAHSNLDAVRGFRASAVNLAFIRQSVREAWSQHPEWTASHVALLLRWELPEIVQGIKALHVSPHRDAMQPDRPWLAVVLTTEDDWGVMTYDFTIVRPRFEGR